MKQFTFEARQKTVLLGLMGLGALCLILSYFIDPLQDMGDAHHVRFWTNLLHNAAFFAGIAFTATFGIAATTLTYAGWNVAFKRIWEAMSLYLPYGLVGIAIVGAGAVLHWHHLYHWADAEQVAKDKILSGKAGFLNAGWFFLCIGFGFVWFWFARKFRQLSVQQDEDRAAGIEYPYYQKLKMWAAVFLPIAGFTSAASIWLWLMSLDAHWYSTMFAWYTTASWWVTAVAITILFIIYLKSKGYMHEVTQEHLHDLGKFLFAFSVFWTYLWFSQYMLIWYANVGEETIYFRARIGEFPVLFYGNLVMNFVLPFLILIRNDTKRKFGTMGFVASLVIFGHWWDFFQMVKIGPYKSAKEHLSAHHGAAHGGAEAGHAAAGHGAEAAHGATHAATDTLHSAAHGAADAAHAGTDTLHTAVAHVADVATTSATETLQQVNDSQFFHYTPDMTTGYGLPGLLELGVFIGFAAMFVFVVLKGLEKASLLPEGDPFLEETLNHHVEMHAEDAHH